MFAPPQRAPEAPPRPKAVAGKAVIFGAKPIRPIINLPADVRKVRLRLRNNSVGRAFLRFDDRIEHWILMPADEQTQRCAEWKLGYHQGTNWIDEHKTHLRIG
jgi:hypothetical protein